MKRRFWWCVALALGLHAAWLLAAGWGEATNRHQVPYVPGPPLKIRTLSSQADALPAPTAPRSLPEPQRAATAKSPEPLTVASAFGNSSADTTAPAPASSPEEAAVPAPSPRPEADAVPARTPADPGLPPPAQLNAVVPLPAPESASVPGSQRPLDAADKDFVDAASYTPRRQLTQAPVAVAPVVLTYPVFEGDEQGSYTAVLALFIDETGKVQRIRVEAPGLPEALEGVARRAFLSARFSPGEVDGRPVRSLIRIEVQFDRGDTTPE
jgi:hypothetical protein